MVKQIHMSQLCSPHWQPFLLTSPNNYLLIRYLVKYMEIIIYYWVCTTFNPNHWLTHHHLLSNK